MLSARTMKVGSVAVAIGVLVTGRLFTTGPKQPHLGADVTISYDVHGSGVADITYWSNPGSDTSEDGNKNGAVLPFHATEQVAVGSYVEIDAVFNPGSTGSAVCTITDSHGNVIANEQSRQTTGNYSAAYCTATAT